MLRILLLLSLGSCCIAKGIANAQEAAADTTARKLVIGTCSVPPFAIKSADGSWDGISIELWREIAAKNLWDYEFREMELPQLLEATEKGNLDAAVAGLTVTHDREKVMDFSHPFYSSGLGIAVRKAYRHDWKGALKNLLSMQFLAVLAILSAMTMLVGLLIWLAERNHNPEQFGGLHGGLGHGIWWAVVTMTTVGYGDKSPKTLPGRLIAISWMLIGVVSLAVIAGSVASQMTVTHLSSPVRGPEDLPRVRTGTVKGTTSEAYLHDRSINFRSYASEMEALQALTNNEIDAVVYDAPTLRYAIHQSLSGFAEVLPVRLQRHDCAIALPTGSALREPINQAITKIIFEPAWTDTEHRHMGY
jgi:ABC-type amino acid transport substrate-binding protein